MIRHPRLLAAAHAAVCLFGAAVGIAEVVA
jgi:hypothetical protein